MQTQIISTEDKNQLNLLPFGKKHPVAALLQLLQVGQHLRISRQDFKWRGKTPGILCKRETKRSGRQFEIMKERGNSGWVVTRVA